MDYITKYYKNLSEQLQEKVNHLTQLIETAELNPDNFDGPDAGRKASSLEVASHAELADYERDPDFHNDVVHELSHHFGNAHPHVTNGSGIPHQSASVGDIQRRLHKIAPVGGYKTFDQASDTLHDIVYDRTGSTGTYLSAMHDRIAGNIGLDKDGDIIDQDARDNHVYDTIEGIHKKVILAVRDRQDLRNLSMTDDEYFSRNPHLKP
jgi:hypothetical protein